MLTKVALEPNATNPLSVGRMGSLHCRPGGVGRAVVDENQLPIAPESTERLDRSPDDLTDGAILVVERDHARNLGRHEIEPTIRFSVDAPALLAEPVQELRDDRSHGASWMARRAVETLSELAEIEASGCEDLLELLRNAGRQLAAC